MIKNIIFDLSEVIISGYHGAENLLGEILDINCKEINEVIKGTEFLELMRGKTTEEEYINQILIKTRWNITLESFKEVIRKNLNRDVPGTMEIIRRLKNKYRLILLSDHVEEWMQYILNKNKELEIFDKKIFSYEIQSLKSDCNTFERVIKDLSLDINETIFIDDSKINVNMARNIGIDGIVFENAEQLKQELIQRNLL